MDEGTKTTLVQSAYERLRDEIRSGVLPPGFHATESEVALHLGMSRTPLREALIRLQADGLVELKPRRGVRVLPLSADDMREIYEMLAVLEPDAAARLAARKPSQDELRPLIQATSDMEAALADGDLESWGNADERFHRSLLQLQGNRRLQRFVSVLFDQSNRARNITMRMRDAPRQSTEEHREILEHLIAGDPEKTRRSFERHRRRATQEMTDLLEKFRLNLL